MLNSKEKELKKLLAEISTSEELDQDKMDELENISKKIDENKVKIDWNIVSSLIEQAKEAISDKVDELREEFNSKKYPTYDDTKLKELLEKIDEEIKEDPLLKESEQKGKQQMVEELIFIGNTLVDIKNLSNKEENNESEKKLDKVNENLEGVGKLLLQILGKTGSNNSFQIKDSNNSIVNPATEETLQSIAGMNLPSFDNGSAIYNDGTFTDIYTFKMGVATVATVTLVYSDATRLKLLTWTKA